jgi:hypothetical protein
MTRSAQQNIEEYGWTPCWICDAAFHRQRETALVCGHCGRGFCRDEHGISPGAGDRFARGIGTCVVCALAGGDGAI